MANGEFPAAPPAPLLLPPRPARRGARPPSVSAEPARAEVAPAAARLVAGEAPVVRPRIAELIRALPIVSLEGPPTPGRPDLTPSPVPRVSLVPPTGQIDRSQLPLPPGDDWRRVPTVAPRRQEAVPTPVARGRSLPQPASPSSVVVPLRPVGAAAVTVPPSTRLRRASWVKDVRSSKREIALGLGIGLGLSVVVGRVGQAYLERRGAAAFAAVADKASAPLGVALEGLRPALAPVPARPLPTQPGRTDLPTGGADPRLAHAPSGSVPELLLGASKPQPSTLAPHTALDRKLPGSAHDTRDGITKPAAPRHVNAATPAGPDAAEAREPSRNAPRSPSLSPSESAGLGLELPL